MKHVKSDFYSKKLKCDGDLYLPETDGKPPVVIMAHGFGALKSFGLKPYMERFVGQGMAVYLFDYRTFGHSEGSPRQVVNPFHHVQDWKNAMAHVRTLDQVDASRMALWGSSFSGGHVLVCAADDPDVKAVISQVAFVSGLAVLSLKSLKDIFLSTVYSTYDILKSMIGLSPHYSPLIARAGSFAVMNSDESYDGYMSIFSDEIPWENKMPSRAFAVIPLYNPALKAKKIKAPVLMVATKKDSLIPYGAMKSCAEKIPDCKLISLDCNHFAPYTGDMFLQHIDAQVDFLKKHLVV